MNSCDVYCNLLKIFGRTLLLVFLCKFIDRFVDPEGPTTKTKIIIYYVEMTEKVYIYGYRKLHLLQPFILTLIHQICAAKSQPNVWRRQKIKPIKPLTNNNLSRDIIKNNFNLTAERCSS